LRSKIKKEFRPIIEELKSKVLSNYAIKETKWMRKCFLKTSMPPQNCYFWLP
jgi:hypothetical protein